MRKGQVITTVVEPLGRTGNLVPRVFALGERNILVWPGHVTRGFFVKWHMVY